jgi:hypothetical protein
MLAGCVSGAQIKEDYLNSIQNAGFEKVEIKKEKEIVLPNDVLE